MVVIRFARTGKKKQAFYRVVVADSKRPVTAKFIKILGWYNPHTKELNIKKEELAVWLSKGAKPSNSLAVILKKEGIKLPGWVVIKEKISIPKKEPKPTENLSKQVDGPDQPELNSEESFTEEVTEEKVSKSEDGGPSTEKEINN